jgi:hypothetical protein
MKRCFQRAGLSSKEFTIKQGKNDLVIIPYSSYEVKQNDVIEEKGLYCFTSTPRYPSSANELKEKLFSIVEKLDDGKEKRKTTTHQERERQFVNDVVNNARNLQRIYQARFY